MILMDKMKNFKIYRVPTFLPTKVGDKKRGSAILLLTPNYESSKRIIESPLFVNNRRFMSYYLEKDISYYINDKIAEEVNESAIYNDQVELQSMMEINSADRSKLSDDQFGVPSKRKFPLDTEQHVRSAIKFFNYVDPEDEEELASRIIEAMKKFNIYGKVNVSSNNRFSKYYGAKSINESADIPAYHQILIPLTLIYYGWKYGTIPENDARNRIFNLMKSNLIDMDGLTPDDIDTPDEYFAKNGQISLSESKVIKNDKGKEVPETCKCGGKVKVFIKGEPVYLCTNCNKYYGTVAPKNETCNSDYLINNINRSDIINTGDKILFFGESNNIYDTRLKKLLFKSRIKYRKDLLLILDQVKKDMPKLVKYAFPEISKYQKKNLWVDLYYYNSIFFQNNTWVAKRGLGLYSEFMNRLINHPNITQNGYTKKTLFIPITDWDTRHDGTVWNYRLNLNPISCIYQLLYTSGLNQLKKAFGNNDVIFMGSDKYFKVNFSEIDQREIKKIAIKFKLFCIKICKNEEFDFTDVDTSAENTDSSEVIQNKIADKIELSKGVDITKHLAKANLNLTKSDTEKKKEVEATNNIKSKSMVPDKPSITVQTKVKPKKAVANNTADDDEDIKLDKEADDAKRDADLEKLATAIANSSINSSSEDDAEDSLDNDDEIKKILLSLGSDDDKVDISPTRAARINQLDENIKDKQIKGKSIRDILDEKSGSEEKKTTINVSSPNTDEWKDLTFVNFDKNYNIDKDIISIFRHFAKCTRPIAIRDIKVTDNSTSEDRVMLYDVDMEDYKGKRFKIKLDIPIMEDNRFLLRGNYKSIQTQFFNMPIIKTDLDTCQLISNYNKIFLRRYGSAAGKSLPYSSRLIKACRKYKGNKLKITYGDNSKVCTKYQLPMDYIDLSRSINTIESSDWIVYFNQDEIRSKYTVEPVKGIPFAYNKKLNAVEYYPPNLKESFCKLILLNMFKIDEDFESVFNSTTASSVCTYSQASIVNSKIPVIVICGYHIGLRNTLEKAGIEYSIKDKLTKEDKLDIDLDWVQFEDGYIVYKVTYDSSLLMNGLKDCSTEMYKLEDIDNKNMYLEFLDNYGGRFNADRLDNFVDLFVDPMNRESLEYYNLPTDYIDILLYGSSMLADNKYIRHTDTSSRRIRRYQLIAVYTFTVLAKAYEQYTIYSKHSGGGKGDFSVKQSAVIDLFLSDSITSDDSCINALRDVETTNSITTKGPSGMNEDRAYSLDKRSYDESMLNVLGMSTGFAGNVGITRQTTINPNITADGYVKQDKGQDSMNDSNTLTATESLIPFGSTRDDPMRTAMSFIQTAKHMVRTEDSDPLLVTSGADEALAYLTTDKFAFKAKEDGIVLEMDENHILVEYISGKKDYINLRETIEKNSDGGYYVPLKLDPVDGLKVNMKFKENQILAYDRYSFSNKLGESDNIAYNIGKLAKVAVLNTDEGFEDSGIISDSMAKKLATRIDLKYKSVIKKDAKVSFIAKIGDHIEAGDDLLIWQDAIDDEDVEDVIKGLSKDPDTFSDLGKRRIKSEVTGVLKDIKIFRTTEIDEMSDSLKKIVNAYERPLREEAKKIKENGLSMSLVPAHYVLPATDKLKKAQNALYFEFFVEYLDTVGVGDKVVYNSANKATEKTIFPIGKEPYTDFRPNEKIDAFVAETSIDKRLVTSTFVYGSLQKLMIELDRSVKDIMGIPYDDTTV